MRFFAIPFYDVVLRYYLMMAVVLIAGFSGLYFLALLALPIFLSAFLGISFRPAGPAERGEIAPVASPARVIELPVRVAAASEKVA